MQPRLPLAGFAVVVGLVLIARAWRERRRLVGVSGLVVVAVGVILLATNGTIGCDADGTGPEGRTLGQYPPGVEPASTSAFQTDTAAIGTDRAANTATSARTTWPPSRTMEGARAR